VTYVVGRTIPGVRVAAATVFDGTNPVAQSRITAMPTTPTGNGTPYVQANFSAIYYTVYRENSGSLFVVDGYEDVPLTIASQVYDTLQGWDADNIGFNFQHVVPLAALEATARHTVVYRFALSASPSPQFTVEHKINYRGLGGLGTSSGGGGGGSTPSSTTLIFSQTQTVTVSNNASASTLVASGSGSNVIAANAPVVGDEYSFEASGYYSTKATPAGGVVMTFHLGAELTLTFPTVELLGSRTNARWHMKGSLTYRTIGGSATVVADAILYVQDAVPIESPAGTTTPVTVPSDSSKVPDLKIDWETADASNSWSCQKFDIRKAGVTE